MEKVRDKCSFRLSERGKLMKYFVWPTKRRAPHSLSSTQAKARELISSYFQLSSPPNNVLSRRLENRSFGALSVCKSNVFMVKIFHFDSYCALFYMNKFIIEQQQHQLASEHILLTCTGTCLDGLKIYYTFSLSRWSRSWSVFYFSPSSIHSPCESELCVLHSTNFAH